MTAAFKTIFPATGAPQLQVCTDCGQVNYPPRELCGKCLGASLAWQPIPAGGVVQSLTELHHSLEPQYGPHLPWPVASVKLDCGPVAFAHLQPGLDVNTAVTLRILADSEGNRMLVAYAADKNAHESIQQWLTAIQFQEERP